MNSYQEITDKVIEMIDGQGIVPWHQPWVGASGAWSHASGKYYSLLNELLLPMRGEWGTFKQWKDSGVAVKKGEKASLIYFYTRLTIDGAEKNEDGELEPVSRTIPFLKRYAVFHSSQIEGECKMKREDDAALTFEHPRLEEAEALIQEYAERQGIWLQFSPEVGKAFFSPASNKIQCPPLNKFREQPEYYSVMFHEMTHSTGEALGRKFANRLYNRKGYAAEELVAEMGAAFLCGHFGILNKTVDNSAAYLKSWRDAIASDSRLIVTAANAAEKAVRFILTGELPQKKVAAAN